MRRLLKGRTWRIRGNNAAETSMVVAVAALVVPILLFVGAGVISYREIEQQAEERISRTLELLYDNARTAFESEYLVAANVTELLEDYATNADIRANEQQLHDRLGQLVGRLPQVEDVWVLDEEGRPVVAAKVFPLPSGSSYADRAYFAALRGGEPRAISKLLQGRVKNIDFFQYSERRQKPDGSFNGAIAVSISPSYFTKQFARASDAPHFTAVLIRADGEILARYPGVGPGNTLGPETGFIRTSKAQPLEGGYTIGSGVIDGVEQIIRYRKIPDLPLYVVHGYATRTIRQAWIDRMASDLIFGLPATLGRRGCRDDRAAGRASGQGAGRIGGRGRSGGARVRRLGLQGVRQRRRGTGRARGERRYRAAVHRHRPARRHNGRQLADAATVRRPQLKVLFTTGYTANAIVHHGMRDPGVNFIGKPFSVSALAAKIKSMGF